MKNKTMRRAMISSILALVLCFAMLIGTTYAWFTDSVASSGNIIKSGTLDIDLEVLREPAAPVTADEPVADEPVAEATYVSIGTDASPIFNYELWEPGYTEWANVRVINKGTLALKYTMRIVPTGTVSALAEVIDVYYAPSEVAKPATRSLNGLTKVGTLKDVLDGAQGVVINDHLLAEESDYATIALHMQESAGNEYQNLSVGSDFTIQILATQYTYEEDSFDNQYDADASLNFAPVANATAFTAALAAGREANLENDVALGEVYEVAEGQNVVIDGNGNTLSSTTGTRIINIDTSDDATLTLNDVDLDASGKERAISIWGSEDVEVNVNGSEVTSDMYTINVAGSNDNVELNITDSTVTGWCAAQTWSPNTTINVENSTLIGNNDKTYNADGWNNFSTIVINEPANGSVITLKNCRIEANATTGNTQTFISFRAEDGATVVCENCTFWKDGVQITDLQEIVDNITFTSWDAINNSHLVINGTTIL